MELKKYLHCRECKTDNHRVLQFHHRDRADKTFSLSDMVAKGYSQKKIEQEIMKCDCMCANCHQELHQLEREKELLDKLHALQDQIKDTREATEPDAKHTFNTVNDIDYITDPAIRAIQRRLRLDTQYMQDNK